MKPTKITNQEPVVGEGSFADSLMKDKPVILDVRPAFEFNLSHVPGAINVRWEDFSQQDPRSRGLLDNDLFSLARRLSLVGIDPDTKVVVLGQGPQGAGEEGRIAWTLKVLGVRDVYTLVHSSYRAMNPKEEPLVQNKPYWKPQVQDSLMISYKEFKNLAEKEDVDTVILDVRLPEEFKLRNISMTKNVKAKLEYLEWKEFFGDKGLPTKSIEAKLTAKGLSKDTRILVISNHGVRSGAATYALQYLGYKNVRNFAGGYEQWK
ncbi:sulfurtransferase [Bdellovibrio bacteriovorus]|uniref:sulfurtransferase n=1 Tax=Bdellovibrio bacteriovorus TaxID=959 RepID=UPI0020A39F12|nr:rhodanese-like domain-containing protein [Bdellovibrio bacteriovorus]